MNVGGVSGPLPGAVFQVSGWCESPLPSLASSGPPPYLQFQSASLVIWGSVASGQGKVVHPAIPPSSRLSWTNPLWRASRPAWSMARCASGTRAWLPPIPFDSFPDGGPLPVQKRAAALFSLRRLSPGGKVAHLLQRLASYTALVYNNMNQCAKGFLPESPGGCQYVRKSQDQGGS